MPKLSRELTLFGLTMIAVGSCIGSGIFLTPATVAGHLSSPELILAVWAVGGLIALTGALTFAELGGMYPEAGGVYVYLREAYGELAGFWYGWAYLVIINSGSLAALSLAFSYYVSFLVPLTATGQTMVACGALLTVTLINVFRVKFVELFSDLFTILKLLGILVIVVVGIVWGTAGAEPVAPTGDVATNTLGAFGLALVGVFFSYGGWQHASYLSGEAKDPKRTIPLAMIFGAAIVTITYLLINLAFLRLMSPAEMAASTSVAADAVSTVMPFGAKFIAVVIAISTFGTTLIYTLSAPRIYFAMAEDGLFFKRFAEVHPKYRTPVFSVVFQTAWAIVLLITWKTFNNVIAYVTFTDWIFFTLAACVVILFRRSRKDADRPYRTFGYPVTPLIFIIVSGLFIVNMILETPQQAIVAIVLLSIGYPVFRYFKHTRDAARDAVQ